MNADTPKRKNLGRGLSALFGEQNGESSEAAPATAVQTSSSNRLPVELLAPSPLQPRVHFDDAALEDLTRIRQLFSALEAREQMVRLLDLVGKAEGVQIFIGAQNELFGMAGCSMIVAPSQNSREQIVGAIGVIGPTRLNYARVIPMVDYTARVVSRLLSGA